MVMMVLSMQDQLEQMNSKLDHLMEQITLANQYRYGRHSEKMKDIPGQLSLIQKACFSLMKRKRFSIAIHESEGQPANRKSIRN